MLRRLLSLNITCAVGSTAIAQDDRELYYRARNVSAATSRSYSTAVNQTGEFGRCHVLGAFITVRGVLDFCILRLVDFDLMVVYDSYL